nr:hypothetical protein [Tanacetum cinerariifolium]
STMDDMNIPANDAPAEQAPTVAPPTRTDDQILSSSKWVPICKNNYVLDVQKSQRNHIFSIVVAILKNTNFFRAFTASSTIPAIYIQQFWDTIDALDITPTNDNNPFVAPPSSNIVIEYVNTLGYPITLRNVSAMSAKTSCALDSLGKNLAMASRGKKKTAHLLIPSVSVEDVPVEEPAYNEEEANLQRALELSLKEQAEQTQGPARLVVIREPDSGRIHSLLGVQGKGKEKRRTLMPTKASGPGESPSLDAKLTLTDSETESNNVVPKINTGDQDEGQAEPNRGEQAVDEIVTDAVDWAMQAPFRARFTHEDHKKLYDALEKSLERDYSDQLLSDLEEACQKKRKRRDVPRTPSGKALSLPKSAALVSQSMAWTTSDIRYESAGLSETQELSPTNSLILDDSIPDEQATALVLAYETPAKNSLFTKTGDMTNFLNWYCRQVNKIMLTSSDLEGQAYEVVKAFYPDVIHLQFQMEECHKMLTDQVDWTNPKGDQVIIDGSSLALSISKMKAASYPNFGLELLVSEQMWIDDVHASPSRQKEVRSTIRILNVVIIKAYSRYGYDYLSEIVLRRVDFQEHTIAEKDFKNLHLNDFEDLNLLLL